MPILAEFKDPILLSEQWYKEACAVRDDANAAVLSTATIQGVPSSRVVLIRQFDKRGLVFFTNLYSRKSRELQENPRAALCFYWPEIDKQLRIEGKVERISDAEADEYYATRPRGSQISAWASKQSQVMETMDSLQERFKAFEQKFADDMIPRPPFWSGYRLLPENFEFWLAGEHRMHTRVLFIKQENTWLKEILYP